MESAVFAAGAALFGACVGSFLNVVIWRLPQEDPSKRSVTGRSYCPACGAQIQWRDNVPVLGWLLLRGRARRRPDVLHGGQMTRIMMAIGMDKQWDGAAERGPSEAEWSLQRC